MFFPTEKAKKIAITQMEQKLHREVSIGTVGLNLFKGIVIKDIIIKDRAPYQKEDFLNCKAFYFKYDLWQLLKRKLVIEKLTLEHPVINIKRYIDKKQVVFNFSDMIPPVPKTQPAKPVKKEVPKKEAPKKAAGATPLPKISKNVSPVDLQIGKVGIDDANITLIDTATPKFNEEYKLSNVHFLIENIKLYENAPMKISTGFGISVKEFQKNSNKQTDKSINLETAIDGHLKAFNDKGILDPSGEFELALKNGKFHGTQAQEQIQNQIQSLSDGITKTQKDILASVNKLKSASSALKQVPGVTSKVDNISSKLANVDLSSLSTKVNFPFLQKDFQFSELKTKVRIEKSKIITDNFSTTTADYIITGGGYTGFDSTVNYKLTALLDKKYNTSEITKFIANKDGQIELGIAVTGTTGNMKYTLDKDTLLNKIQTGLKNKLGIGGNNANSLQDQGKQMLNNAADEAKKKAQAELDAQKKAQEDAAKQKAQDAAKNQLKKLKF